MDLLHLLFTVTENIEEHINDLTDFPALVPSHSLGDELRDVSDLMLVPTLKYVDQIVIGIDA
jgi:hypothetical protein